jgi:hypothetical protein
MWLRDAEQSRESGEELAARERQGRGQPTADRFKMLRLLQNGTVRSRRGLGEVLG